LNSFVRYLYSRKFGDRTPEKPVAIEAQNSRADGFISTCAYSQSLRCRLISLQTEQKINKKALLIVVDAKRMQEAPEGVALAIIILSSFNSCKVAYPNIYYYGSACACFHGCILGE